MKNIAVFASHGGSGLQAIIDGCKAGNINAKVCVVISNNSDSKALQRAKNEGIPAFHISQKTAPDSFAETIINTLEAHETDIVFLAGYLKKIPKKILQIFENRIFNIHPSLLPKYGGKGMFGINVHKAVLDAGETKTGITIHQVTAEYDKGDVFAQKIVSVKPDDTPETLAARVLQQEYVFLVEFLGGILT